MQSASTSCTLSLVTGNSFKGAAAAAALCSTALMMIFQDFPA